MGVPADTVEAGSSTVCTLGFQPTGPGVKAAKLTIPSSDEDEAR